MKKDELLFATATYNADPFNVDTCDLLDEVWDVIESEGYHEINQDTEDYEIGCAQLDLSPKVRIKVYETNNHTMKFAYEF